MFHNRSETCSRWSGLISCNLKDTIPACWSSWIWHNWSTEISKLLLSKVIVFNDVSRLVVPLHPCLTLYLPHFIINADLYACFHKQCISVSRDLFNTLSFLVEWIARSLRSWHCTEEANWDSELKVAALHSWYVHYTIGF